MKYFLTEHGLQPFDLSANQLIAMLLDNIKPGEEGYFKKPRTRTSHTSRAVQEAKVMSQLVNAVNAILDEPHCLFKHPDTPLAVVREMVNYKKGKNDAAFAMDESEMFGILYSFGQITIITSFTAEKNPVTDYTIQLILVAKPIFKSWERNLIIDNVLKELP